MPRNILFITTDQRRFDALGCTVGEVARTPVVDRLAAEGFSYRRAHNQNVVCMPVRSTMLTRQYVRNHGCWMNGVPLPVEAPSIAACLKSHADYRTALLGKAQFEPAYDPGTLHDGSGGELYDLENDPRQCDNLCDNLWDDPARRRLRDELVAELYASLPPMPEPWPDCEAPV